jgi:hypothetical protein
VQACFLLRTGKSSYDVPQTNSKEEALVRHNLKAPMSKFFSLQEVNASTKYAEMYAWSVLTGWFHQPNRNVIANARHEKTYFAEILSALANRCR